MFIAQVEVSHNDASNNLGPETIPLHKTPEGRFYNTETTINLILEETEVFTRNRIPDTIGKFGQIKDLLPSGQFVNKNSLD